MVLTISPRHKSRWMSQEFWWFLWRDSLVELVELWSAGGEVAVLWGRPHRVRVPPHLRHNPETLKLLSPFSLLFFSSIHIQSLHFLAGLV